MTAFTIPFPRYQRTEQLSALKIKAVVPNQRGKELHFEDDRFCPIEVSAGWMKVAEPLEGGYFLAYDDGCKSWMSAAAFEAGYTMLVETGSVGPATQAAREVVL